MLKRLSPTFGCPVELTVKVLAGKWKLALACGRVEFDYSPTLQEGSLGARKIVSLGRCGE